MTDSATIAQDPTSQLIEEIKNSISSGSPFIAIYEQILAAAKDPDQPEIDVSLDINESLSNIVQSGAVLEGIPILRTIPANSTVLQGIFDDIELLTVDFKLIKAEKKVESITLTIEMGKNGEGVSLEIVNEFVVTLTKLVITLTSPATADQAVEADASGTVKIGDATLEVELAFPDLETTITLQKGDTIGIGDFLKLLNLQGVPPFISLQLTDLDFTSSLNAGSLALSSDVIYVDSSTSNQLPLIPETLLISDMHFDFNVFTGSTSGDVAGSLNFRLPGITQLDTGLLFEAKAAYAKEEWVISGNIDIAGTLKAWNITNDTELRFQAIAENLFNITNSSLIPPGLSGLAIASIDASYTTSEDAQYSFNGVFSGAWVIANVEVQTQVTIAIVKAEKEDDSKQTVDANFNLDGFLFSLGFDFKDELATAAIPLLGLNGSYDFNKEILNLTFSKTLTLTEVLEWFVMSVTGNSGFQFGSPWSDILNEVGITAGSKLTINFNEKSVDVTYVLPTAIKFVGNEIDSISIKYDPTNKLKFTINGSFPGLILFNGDQGTDSTKAISWDPSQPGTEPAVPGKGRNKFDLQLVAMGQHIGYPAPAPTGVEDAINTLINALVDNGSNSSLFPDGLQFQKNGGWLIGTKAVISSQLVIQIIFNDPNIYGLLVEVQKVQGENPSDGKLDAFIGLMFEVLYRKVNDTIGEYYVALTLPEKFRNLNFGAVAIQLPSFSLAIYTNGNFKIDIGFPQNADFSNSFALTYQIFTGQGGFYFGVLSGATANNLPTFNPDLGNFNPVIELGIGLAVGIQRGFKSGPLSAQLSLLLQAIIEGTYAKYVSFQPVNGKNSDIYYKVKGTVGLVGELTGKVDLVIITASLLIRIAAYATLVIEAYRKTEVGLSLEVEVELKVKINLGLFSIHINVGFKTKISTSFEFGTNSTGLWSQGTATAAAFLAESASTESDFLGWQAIKPTALSSLTAYLVPQLTIGDVGDQKSVPLYVGILYLNNPDDGGTATNGELADTDPSFETFANGVLLWAMNAYNNSDTTSPIAIADVLSKDISLDDINSILDLLDDTNQQFSSDQLQAFTSLYYELNLTALPESSTAANYNFAFFPIPTELEMSYSQEDSTKDLSLNEPLKLSNDYLDHISGNSKSGMLQQQYLEAVPVEGASQSKSTSTSSLDQQLVDEYVILVAKSVLNEAVTFLEANSSATTIGDVMKGVQGSLGGAAGFASRHMYHGIRMAPSTSTTVLEPLYQLSGQQFAVSGTTATSSSLNLSIRDGADNTWNIPTDSSSVKIASGDNSILKSPQDIADNLTLSFDPGTTDAGELDIAQTTVKRYGLSNSTPLVIADDSASSNELWSIPNNLQNLISSQSGKISFDIHKGEFSQDGSLPDPVPTIDAADLAWVSTINFTIRQIASGETGGGSLPTVFEFEQADALGLLRLTSLIKDISNGALDNAEMILAYPKKVNNLNVQGGSPPNNSNGLVASFQAVEPNQLNTAIVQTNLSTESQPANATPEVLAFAQATADSAMEDFLSRLWSGAITNSGGYYFFYNPVGTKTGLPTDIFDQNGRATITLMVAFKNSGSTLIPPKDYMNHLQILNNPDTDTSLFFAASDSITQTKATIDPGHVGINIQRPMPTAPTTTPTGGTTDYSSSINNLYNLLTCYISSIGSQAVTAPNRTSGLGPLNADSASTDSPLIYRKVLPLLPTPSTTPTQVPPADQNPYAAIGEEISFFSSWTDVFGNQLSSPAVGLDPIESLYYDNVLSINQLPSLSSHYEFNTSGTNGSAKLTLSFNYSTDGLETLSNQFIPQVDALIQAIPSLPTTYDDWQSLTTALNNLVADELDASQQQMLAAVQQSISGFGNDQGVFASLYYQLVQDADNTEKNISAILQSSILTADLTTASDAIVAGLSKNAVTVYAYYGQVEDLIAKAIGSSDTIEMPTISLDSITIEDGFSTTDLVDDFLYILSLNIQLKRNGLIHPDFKNVPGVQSSESVISPLPDLTSDQDSGQTFTFTQFATDFQSAFSSKSMVVMTGPVWEAGQPSNAKQLWVMRYGENGITVTETSNPSYFSPRPLSNVLLSGKNLDVQQYNSGTGELDSDGTTISVSNIDLDLMMKGFLQAVEQFLSPEFAVSANLANSTAFDTVIASKKSLVESLVKFLTNLSSTAAPTDATSAAVEKLRQLCLISLNEFYEIDGLVSQELDTSFNDAGSATIPVLNLFGAPTPVSSTTADGTNTDVPAFSLTSAKSALEEKTYISYAVKSRQKKLQAEFDSVVEFKLDSIEHDLETFDENGSVFVSGSWVKFVLAPDKISFGQVNLPIPLRAFPTPPSLLTQTFSTVLQDTSSSESSSSLIEKAKEWNYDASYNHEFVAQDTTIAVLTINAGSSADNPVASAQSSSDDPLLQPLVNFNNSYPAIKHVFETELQEIVSDTGVSDSLKATVASFSSLVEQVATALESPNTLTASAALESSLPIRQSQYNIEEGIQMSSIANSSDDFFVQVTEQEAEGSPYPLIGILPEVLLLSDGVASDYLPVVVGDSTSEKVVYKYVNKENQTLTLEDALEFNQRTLQVPALNIIDSQNGISEIKIKRNANLPAEFVYQTPFNSYPDRLIPHIDLNTPINIAEDDTDSTIQAILTALFDTLLLGSDGQVTDQEGSFRMVCYYEYQLLESAVDSEELPLLSVPLVLNLPVTLPLDPSDSAVKTYIDDLSSRLQSWLTDNQPQGLVSSAEAANIRFDLTIFSELSKSGEPILRLRDLYLPLSTLKE